MNTLTHSQYIVDALISSALCLGKLLGPEQVVTDKIHTFGEKRRLFGVQVDAFP